jgi:hypothetical protein
MSERAFEEAIAEVLAAEMMTGRMRLQRALSESELGALQRGAIRLALGIPQAWPSKDELGNLGAPRSPSQGDGGGLARWAARQGDSWQLSPSAARRAVRGTRVAVLAGLCVASGEALFVDGVERFPAQQHVLKENCR